MERTPTTATVLAGWLTSHQRAIAAVWARYRQQHMVPPTATVPLADLEDWAAQGLAALSTTLRTNSFAPMDAYLQQQCQTYQQRGLGLGTLLEELLCCKEAVSFVLLDQPGPDAPRYPDLIALDRCLRQAVGLVGAHYAARTHWHLHEQQQRANLMLDATHRVSSAHDLDLALTLIAEDIATAAGGCCCGIYLLDGEAQLLVPRTLSRHVSDGQRSAFFRHPVRVATDALAARAIQQHRPIVSADQQASGAPPEALGHALGCPALLVLPLRASGRVLGLALTGSRHPAQAFRPEQVELAWGLARAVALAVENAQFSEQICQRLAESQSLQRVTAALLHKLALDEVLEVVCVEALAMTGAHGSSVVLLEDDAWLRVAHRAGTIAPAFERMPVAGSFTGQAVQQRAPLLSNDPPREIPWYRAWGEPTAFLVAPLCVQEMALGAIDLVNKPGGFTADDMRLIRLFADQAAIAIEHARLYQQVEHLAVVAERQRMAHDLHDSLSQALYSLTLYGEAAASALRVADYPTTTDHVAAMQTIAFDALREMRLLIFNLRPPVLEQEGLTGALQRRLESVEARVGLQPTLRVVGTEALAPAVQEALYYIAQEALSNVLRHANARQVTVALQYTVDHTSMEIGDDGVGFDLTLLQTTGGLGICGMRERMHALGGSIAIQSAPGQGTTLCVEVPQ